MMPTRQTLPAVGPRPPAISTLYLSMAFLHRARASTPSGTCSPAVQFRTVLLCMALSHGHRNHSYLLLEAMKIMHIDLSIELITF